MSLVKPPVQFLKVPQFALPQALEHPSQGGAYPEAFPRAESHELLDGGVGVFFFFCVVVAHYGLS
jgi:hypothetical protein